MKKLVIALVLFPTLAFGQNVTNGAIPLGRGFGATGWGSVGPCAFNQSVIYNGPTDPVCEDINVNGVGKRFIAKGVNVNTTNDTPISIILPSGSTNYRIQFVVGSNASTSLTTAVCGLWTGDHKTGVTVIGSGSTGIALSTLTGAAINSPGSLYGLTLNATITAYNANALYWSCSTPQGTSATLDLTIAINILN